MRLRRCRSRWPRLVAVYYAAVVLFIGPLVLVEAKAQGSQPTPEVAHAPPLPDAHGGAVPVTPPASQAPTAVPSLPPSIPGPQPAATARDSQPQATIRKAKPAAEGTAPARTAGDVLTLASWYAWTPPAVCWDSSGAHAVSRTRMFTAMRDIACGTPVRISGPNRSVTVPVVDHGPWIAGRDLDMSADAFAAVFGSLTVGVGPASYRIGG